MLVKAISPILDGPIPASLSMIMKFHVDQTGVRRHLVSRVSSPPLYVSLQYNMKPIRLYPALPL